MRVRAARGDQDVDLDARCLGGFRKVEIEIIIDFALAFDTAGCAACCPERAEEDARCWGEGGELGGPFGVGS